MPLSDRARGRLRPRRLRRTSLALAAGLVSASAGGAQSWGELELVPNGFVELAGTLVAPSEALRVVAPGTVAGRVAPFVALPPEVNLAAYDRRADGALLVSTAVPWLSPEGVLFDGDRLVLVDPEPLAPPILPPLSVRARIDAVAHLAGSSFLFSLDETAGFKPTGFVEDEDLLLYDAAAGTLDLFLDLSSAIAEIPSEADLDAVAWLQEEQLLLLSFDLPFEFLGELVRPSDVIGYRPSTGARSIEYRSSLVDPEWTKSDLVALDGGAAGFPDALFADGVESGDAGRWSAAVP